MINKAHVIEGEITFSGIQANPSRWVRAADYEALWVEYEKLTKPRIQFYDYPPPGVRKMVLGDLYSDAKLDSHKAHAILGESICAQFLQTAQAYKKYEALNAIRYKVAGDDLRTAAKACDYARGQLFIAFLEWAAAAGARLPGVARDERCYAEEFA